MEGRYVEMFPASEQELSAAAAQGGILGYESNNPNWNTTHTVAALLGAGANAVTGDLNPQENREGSGWLRLRGVPYQATQAQVTQFFAQASMDWTVPDTDVTIKYGSDGRPSGEMYVQVENYEMAELMSHHLHRQNFGGRYVEVFPCSYEDTLIVRTIDLDRMLTLTHPSNSRNSSSVPYLSML